MLLAAVLFALHRSEDKSLPWIRLGLFASFMCISQWLELVIYSAPNIKVLSVQHSISVLLAVFCLLDFGRIGLKERNFGYHNWLIPITVLPVFLSFLAEPKSPFFSISFFGIMVGGIASGFAFWSLSRSCTGFKRYSLIASAFFISVYSLVANWAFPKSATFPTNIINAAVFHQWFGFSAQMAQGFSVFWLFASLWLYYNFATLKNDALNLSRFRLKLLITFGMSLLAIIGLGWLMTNSVSKNTEAHLRDRFKADALSASTLLNPIQVSKLTGLAQDVKSTNYRAIRNCLQIIKAGHPELRYVYLMGLRKGEIIFLADAEPMHSPNFSPPGQVYYEADAGLKSSLFILGKPTVTGPLRDRWGIWISAFAPIRDPRNNLVVAILGLDIDASDWERLLASHRLMPITLTLIAAVVATLISILFLYSRESAAKIEASEFKYRYLVETSPNLIALVGSDCRVLMINQTWKKKINENSENLIGKDFKDLWTAETRHLAEEAMNLALQGSVGSFVSKIFATDHTETIVDVRLNPVVNASGVVTQIVCIANDITDAKRAEEDLIESRRALATLLSNMPGMAYRCKNDKNWTIEFVSDGCFDLTGYRPEELTGGAKISYADLIHSDDRNLVWDSVQEAIAKRKPYQITYRINTALDEEKWVWEQGQGIFAEKDELVALEGLIIDITSRKMAEEALKENEQILRQVLNALPVGVWTVSTKGEILSVNPAGREIWGDVKYGDFECYKEYRAWRLDDGKRVEPEDWAVVQVLREGKPRLNDLLEIETFDGKRKIILNSAVPVFNSVGEIINVIVVNQDITSIHKAELAIREAEAKYKSIVENSPIGIFQFAINGQILSANPSFAKIFGYQTPRALLSTVKRVFDIISLEAIGEEGEPLRNALKQTGYIWLEVRLKKRNGKNGVGNLHLRTVNDDFGNIRYLDGFLEDITERKEAEAFVRMQTSAINAAGDQIVITDPNGRIEFANPAFEKETGYSLNEIAGASLRILKSGRQNEEFYQKLWQTISSGKTWHGEIINRRKNGELYTEDMTITPVKNEKGVIEHFVAIKRNITEKKIYEERLDHLAHHDPLTGLPNRLLFSDQLAHRLRQAAKQEETVAVLFLDLDRFKLINDTLGHNVGDLLLKEVSRRLLQCLRKGDIVSRMGGDEFTIIPQDVKNNDEAATVAQKVLNIMNRPFLLAGREMFVSASIGISLFPHDGQDVETLVKNADSAMYRAKEKGRNKYEFYTESLNVAAMKRMALENSLRKALKREELSLHYQPRVDIHTGIILGVESLLRWHHPEYGNVPPSQFIPLAEENGLIIPISEWVLRKACSQAKVWHDAGIPPFDVAVNISAMHLHQCNLVQVVGQILEETQLDPRYLDLEITESTLMHNAEEAIRVLSLLKEMGVRISIDDFGTGYSSLSYLKKLPIDALKIDHSFIRDITTNFWDAAIAGAVTAMAHNLKLKVIAEGVETLEQLEFLRSIHCDEVQGYFISRPMPADQIAELLMENKFRYEAQDQLAA